VDYSSKTDCSLRSGASKTQQEFWRDRVAKIMLIGSGGAGKSTLAIMLGDLADIPVYHLDALYWKPGWLPTPREEWDEVVRQLVKKDRWIIDGDYGRTLDIRMSEADTIIFLDFPRWITLYRVIKRRIRYHNRTRPDMHDGCPEKLDSEFMSWIWNYRKDKRPRIMQKIETLADKKKVIIIRTPNEVRQFIKKVKSTDDFLLRYRGTQE
jgi:adenylate kinase family enzyme